MSMIEIEDVRGAFVDGQVRCLECLGTLDGIAEADLILASALEDEDRLFYCDGCPDHHRL